MFLAEDQGFAATTASGDKVEAGSEVQWAMGSNGSGHLDELSSSHQAEEGEDPEWHLTGREPGEKGNLDDPEPRQTAVVEQCVAWGGEARVRVQITLACAGERPSVLPTRLRSLRPRCSPRQTLAQVLLACKSRDSLSSLGWRSSTLFMF